MGSARQKNKPIKKAFIFCIFRENNKIKDKKKSGEPYFLKLRPFHL